MPELKKEFGPVSGAAARAAEVAKPKPKSRKKSPT